MRFIFQNDIEKYHVITFFGVIYITILFFIIFLTPSLNIFIIVALMSFIVFLFIIYINWISTPWDRPTVYIINSNVLTITIQKNKPINIHLDSIWKIYFQNGKHSKKLILYFTENEQKMFHKMSVFRDKSWPREQWQQLFEELKKRCPNAEIIEK